MDAENRPDALPDDYHDDLSSVWMPPDYDDSDDAYDRYEDEYLDSGYDRYGLFDENYPDTALKRIRCRLRVLKRLIYWRWKKITDKNFRRQLDDIPF
jgi:hypothetical protein